MIRDSRRILTSRRLSWRRTARQGLAERACYFSGVGDSASRVGSIVASKYRLDEELGRGGMGAVYRAYHLRVHKEFALKVLLSEVMEHRSIASRFFLEAQAAGRIGHPGILDVYDVGEDTDGTPFIVMELLRGEPLSSLVRRERLDVDAACWIAMEVLDVLDAAHRAGIVHRDVKPQNVFVTERVAETTPVSGKTPSPSASAATLPGSGLVHGVKLLDFGVAKFGSSADGGSVLTRSGEIIGSPLYMAPEQAKGDPDLDARADVWSVGAMLFEMLTGKCAHAATTPVAVLAKILTEPAPFPSTRDDRVPPELDVVVARALRIDRLERWPSAREMRDALADVRAKRGTAEKPPNIPRAPKRPTPLPPADRTPGAITSTVAAGSDPPKRPWSSHPKKSTGVAAETEAPGAQRRGLSTGGWGEGEAVVGSAVTNDAGPARSRMYAAGAALVAAAVLVGAYVYTTGRDAPAPAGASSSASTLPAATSAAPAASSASELVEAPSATASAPGSATPPDPVASASVSAPDPVASVPRPIPAPAVAKCAANEVLSHGHCCQRGLEWQGGRCERPLATTF
jgi:serine/threonine-protein kinase